MGVARVGLVAVSLLCVLSELSECMHARRVVVSFKKKHTLELTPCVLLCTLKRTVRVPRFVYTSVFLIFY
eukprot:SAG11_NODE_8693_length_986_cov_1.936866_1_plen_70_part_00